MGRKSMIPNNRESQSSLCISLLLLLVLCISGSNQLKNGGQEWTSKQEQNSNKLSPTNNTDEKQQQSTGVEDILNDTISLLDELDKKLVAVNNRTPTAMMRDNLRALESDFEELSAQGAEQQKLVRSLNGFTDSHNLPTNGAEDGELEEALVKLAEGFSSDRKTTDLSPRAIGTALDTRDDSLIASASTNRDHSIEPAAVILNKSSSESFNSDPVGAGTESKKKARQIIYQQQQQQHSPAFFLDDNQLASDSTERHIKFTLDLMQAIFASQSYSPKTNLIESFLISPLSIQMVLMMMHLGARGQTKREISNCLHLSSNSANSLQLEKALGTIVSQQQQSQTAPETGGSSEQGSKLKRRHQLGASLSMESNKQRDSVSKRDSSSSSSSSSSSQTAQSGAVRQQQQQLSAGNNAHEIFGAAMRNLLRDPTVMKALTSANQIFLQKNLPLSPQYEWAIKHYYAADVKLVDFQHQSSGSQQQPPNNGAISEKSEGNADFVALNNSNLNSTNLNSTANSNQQANNIQQMVNDWVERQTKGRISNFLSSPISTSTLMMAINVLYFKGDWQYKFDPADTETDSWFTQANGKTVKMPMLVNRLPLAFAHDPVMKTSVIELPYKAQRLGLFLLLPDEVSGIFHTMQMLNSTSFANLISSMRKPSPLNDQGSSGINVRIPKFSIDSSPRLSQILSQHLGLKSLFMPDSADLSGIFAPLQIYKRTMMNSNNNNTSHQFNNNGNSSQQTPLQVGLDELLHKAVLQVDEQGSVAAASSATIVERVGLFNSNYFEADHPFLLFLMDKQTGLVLFSGVFAGNGQSASTNNNKHEQTQQQRQQQH